MGHVNNAVYLRWVQEAVMRYWEAWPRPTPIAQHLWVALKHEISYFRPTFLDDGVVAEVIAERVQGARSFFSTVFRRGEDVLAEVRSSWCCLDAATRRPRGWRATSSIDSSPAENGRSSDWPRRLWPL
jgi:acyl-CoA thioester hydrolase